MKMQNVEFAGTPAYLLELQYAVGYGIPDLGQPEGLGPARDQLGGGLEVTACEQHDLVSLLDEFFGQIRDDTLGPAVKLRWYAFDEWGNLRNLYFPLPH
jgi:hypothetical protein